MRKLDPGHPLRWVAWCGVSGLAMALALPPWDVPWVGFVGLVAAVGAWWRSGDAVASFVRPWVVHAVAAIVSFYWVVRHPYPQVAMAGALVVVLIPMLIGAFWSLAWRLTRGLPGVTRGVALVASVVLLETVLYSGPVPLPWGLPSQFLSSWRHLDGLTAYLGPTMSATIALGAAAALSYPVLRGTSMRRRTIPIVAGLIVVLGAGVIHPPVPTPAGTTVRVGLVQPGMDALSWEAANDRVGVLASLSDSLLRVSDPPPDWLLWPENSLRTKTEIDSTARLTARWNVTIVSGAQVSDGDPPARTNSVLVFSEGRVESRYDKRLLVPFVEQVPFEERFAWLGLAGLEDERYRKGALLPVVEIDAKFIGIGVCFESLFPSHALESAALGARMLAMVTNDGWWDSRGPADLHASFARGRALETGLPLVQASVNGFTGVLSPDGSVEAAAAYGERRAATVLIPLAVGRSGPVPNAAAWIALLTTGFLAVAARRRKPAETTRVDASP